MTLDLRDAVFFAGLVAGAVGSWLWHPPSAGLWVGGVLVYVSLR